MAASVFPRANKVGASSPQTAMRECSVGAALAAGYLIVPQRAVVLRPDAEALVELARKHQLVVKTNEGPAQKKRGGLLAQLLSLAAATLLQGGLKIATNQLSEAFSHNGHAHSNGRSGGVTP